MNKAKHNYCIFTAQLDNEAVFCYDAICDSMEEVDEEEARYNGKLSAAYPLIVRGETYADKQANLRYLAVEISNNLCGGLSWGEDAILQRFFYTSGKRYGLLREFRENGIC